MLFYAQNELFYTSADLFQASSDLVKVVSSADAGERERGQTRRRNKGDRVTKRTFIQFIVFF